MENLLKGADQAKRDELAKDVRNKFRLSRDFYDEKFALFKRLYKEYKAHRDDAQEGEWSIKIALAYGLVENIVSRIVQTVLGKLSVEVKPKRDDQAHKAENFYNMARTYFGSPEYRIEYTCATRERVVCGTAFEIDDWVEEYLSGFRWMTTKMEEVANMDIPLVSSIAKVARKIAFKGYKKVEHLFPVNVGYQTRFPSIFSIFPQPGVIRCKDLKWFVEEVTYKALEDLEKCQYTDENGDKQPVYDLAPLKKMQEQKIRITPTFPENRDDLAKFREEMESAPTDKNRDKDDGIDAVHLLILRNEREQITIANGVYAIQHAKDIYHKPGIRLRARYYTPSNHSIYAMGALEPVVDQLNEFSDIHSLAMQDWFRSVNQMVAVVEDAFPYPEDFEPTAGGRIRAAANVDLSRAIMPIAKQDKIGSMLTAQSGVQGLIENIVSVAEMTPGAMGTRPYHQTYGGLMQIESNMARRFGLMMNIDQCETMKQMDSMYWIYEQFMFDPIPFKKFQDGIGAVTYKREDIDTDGEGFLYVVADDPSFGDTQVQRNQALVLLSQTLVYADAQLRHPEWDKADAGEVFSKVLDAFGLGDSTKILKKPDGSVDPDQEYELMLQGVPVETQPKENKTWHLIKHMIQRQMLANNPNVDPGLLARLVNHIAQTQQDILDVTQNPEQYAAQYAQEEAIKQQGQAALPTQPSLGQSSPAVVGAQPGQGDI